MRALSVLAARWRRHTCTPLTDAISGDVRCWCGHRPEHETTLRRALHAEGQRIESKTAAPAGPGTAEPTDCKESTGMPTLPTSDPAEAQTAAALALAHLTRMDLPRIEWRITRDGTLCGHVDLKAHDEAARDAVRAYARVLRATVVPSQGRGERTEYLHVETVGTYWGATVRVWTHVDVRPVSPYGSFGGTR